MRRLLLVATVALALVAVPGAGPAVATPVNQRVDIVFVGAQAGVVTARGAIDAVGLVSEENTLNPDGSFHGMLRFVFPLGSVTAPFTGMVTEVEVDPATCTGRFATVGRFTIASATGAYAGASGSGQFSERGTFNAVPSSSGCSPTLQVRTLLVTEATGSVTLPRRTTLLGL